MFAYGPPDLDPTIRTYPDLDLISRVKFGSGGSGHLGARSGGGRSPATNPVAALVGDSPELANPALRGSFRPGSGSGRFVARCVNHLGHHLGLAGLEAVCSPAMAALGGAPRRCRVVQGLPVLQLPKA